MRPLRAIPDSGDIVDLLKAHPRAFTRGELIALGNEHQFRAALSRGDIARLLPNSYVSIEHADSFEARADAALTWAGTGSALTGASACFAWTLTATPPARIDLVVPPSKRLSPPPWLRVIRAPWVEKARLVGDFRTVFPAIAIADGYCDLTDSERIDAVYGGIARRLVTTRDLRQVLSELPRIRARRSLTSRIEAAERGAESWLEEIGLREVFQAREFGYFLRQHEVTHRDFKYRLDMYDPFTRTCIELDSYAWHSRDKQRLADIRRDAELAALGILTVRLPTQDLTHAPDWCRDVVRRTVAQRRGGR